MNSKNCITSLNSKEINKSSQTSVPHRTLHGTSFQSELPILVAFGRQLSRVLRCMHLRCVTTNVTLTFEELATVLAQIGACLNNRPLVPMPCDNDRVQAFTLGHFLIGCPIESLPDRATLYQSMSCCVVGFYVRILLNFFELGGQVNSHDLTMICEMESTFQKLE